MRIEDLRVVLDTDNTERVRTRPVAPDELLALASQQPDTLEVWWCEKHTYSGIEKSCIYGHVTSTAKTCRMIQRLLLAAQSEEGT